jgi:hypothetical protein
VVDGTATRDNEIVVETITSLSDEEDDASNVFSRKIDEYDAAFGAVADSTEEDATDSSSSDQEQSANDEISNQESDSSNQSPTDSHSSPSGSEVKSQKSHHSEGGESARIDNVVSFPAVEDDSIPSNESYDETKENKPRNKKAFKPLASFRKRVTRAASIIVCKNSKKKNSQPKIKKQVQPSMYTSESLHDRVYHDNIPATQSRVTIDGILHDLQIIEDTAQVMWQDRFSNTPSVLNPVDESSGQKLRGCDDASELTKKTTQSRLSGIFDGYFAPGSK